MSLLDKQHYFSNSLSKNKIKFICKTHGSIEGYINPIDQSGVCEQCIDEQNKSERIKNHDSRIEHLMKISSIPARYQQHPFLTNQNEKKQHARKTAINWTSSMKRDKWSHLFIHGPTGTGKTLLSCRAAMHIIQQSALYVKYATSVGICDDVKLSYSDQRINNPINCYINDVDLLIIDEIDTLLTSEHDKVVIHKIIRGRYEQMKPIITVSNNAGHKLVDVIGQRVYSALQENVTTIFADWEDYRIQHDSVVK